MIVKVGDIVTIDYVYDESEYLPPLFEYVGEQKILEIFDDSGKFYSESGITIFTDGHGGKFDIGWIKTLNGDHFNPFSDYPSDWKHPDWGNCGKCHDWKNHISVEIRENWETFRGFQRRLLVSQAQAMSDLEWK